jgi:hypothetical protein
MTLVLIILACCLLVLASLAKSLFNVAREQTALINELVKDRAERRESAQRLAEKWRASAARKFHDAELEPDEMGRRLIEHGAVCLFNCSQEAQTLAGALPVLTIPGESQKSTPPPA